MQVGEQGEGNARTRGRRLDVFGYRSSNIPIIWALTRSKVRTKPSSNV